jgi:hypothetical protein
MLHLFLLLQSIRLLVTSLGLRALIHKIEGSHAMEFKIPHTMKLEHDELHAQLVKATKERGKVGEAARAVAAVLHAHFVNEEAFAIPPLSLLRSLAEGTVSEEMGNVLQMTEKLKQELPKMLREHREIVSALEKLKIAAKRAKKPRYIRFAEKLALHAQGEEEVSYPTAILIGEYIKLKLNK